MNIKSIIEPLLKYRVKDSLLYHEGINKISILNQDLEHISKEDCNNLLTILLAKMYIVDFYTPMSVPLLNDIRLVFTQLEAHYKQNISEAKPILPINTDPNTHLGIATPKLNRCLNPNTERDNPLDELESYEKSSNRGQSSISPTFRYLSLYDSLESPHEHQHDSHIINKLLASIILECGSTTQENTDLPLNSHYQRP